MKSPGLQLDGSTELIALIGNPVRMSISPAVHNAAFAACGLNMVYLVLELESVGLEPVVAAARHLGGLRGLNVTMPHKRSITAGMDRLDHYASTLGAVNCVVKDQDELVGYNTDAPGYLQGLVSAGVDPAGMRCVVIGGGGAARAVIAALCAAGADDIVVLNRTLAAAEAAAAIAGARGRVGTAVDLGRADLVVNATSIGMRTGEMHAELPFDLDFVRDDAVISDIIIYPPDTPLVRSARERGHCTVDGAGMFIHQAALAFSLWTGHEAPLEVIESVTHQLLG